MKLKIIALLVLSLIFPPLGLAIVVWLLAKKRPLPWRYLSLVVILAVLGCLGWLAVYKKIIVKEPAPSVLIDAKAYKNLTLKGSKNSGSISFDYPADFKRLDPVGSSTIANFSNEAKVGSRTVTLAGEVVTVSASTEKEVQILSQDLALPPSSSANQQATLALKNFAQSLLPYIFYPNLKPADLTVTLSNQSKLTTPNIKSGMWVAGFSASNPKGGELSSVKGEVGIILQGSTKYFVLLAATADNWGQNLFVWGHLMDSLKLSI